MRSLDRRDFLKMGAAGLVGAYGNSLIRTPNLDRLAREGVRFTQFHIGAFACGPSRACLLTGQWAHNTGVVRNDVPLPAEMPCLGDVLAHEGYDTAYVGKWHLSGMMYRDLPGAQPFDGSWYWKRLSKTPTASASNRPPAAPARM